MCICVSVRMTAVEIILFCDCIRVIRGLSSKVAGKTRSNAESIFMVVGELGCHRFLWWIASILLLLQLYYCIFSVCQGIERENRLIFFSGMEHQTISTINRCYFIVCLTEVLICSTHALTFNHRKYCRFDKTMLDPRHKIQGMSSISWNRCVRVCAIEPEAVIKSNDSLLASEANPKYPHTTQNPNCRKISEAMCFFGLLWKVFGCFICAPWQNAEDMRICREVQRFMGCSTRAQCFTDELLICSVPISIDAKWNVHTHIQHILRI